MQKLELAARVMNKFASVQMWISLTCCDIARCRGADGISDGPTAAGHKTQVSVVEACNSRDDLFTLTEKVKGTIGGSQGFNVYLLQDFQD